MNKKKLLTLTLAGLLLTGCSNFNFQNENNKQDDEQQDLVPDQPDDNDDDNENNNNNNNKDNNDNTDVSIKTFEQTVQDSYDLCEEIEQKGTVLLKNDNDCLPLKSNERKITLFGKGSKNMFMCSNASAPDYNEDQLVTLDKAFEDRGFEINRAVWDLVDAGDRTQKYRDERLDVVSKFTSEIENTFDEYNVAVIVISRSSEENNDYAKYTDLEISSGENRLINYVHNSRKFSKVILLVNTPTNMPLYLASSFSDQIDAALYIGAPGYYGVGGVVNLIKGENKKGFKVSPCGRLTETFTDSANCTPAYVNYGSQNIAVYQEGIYVGYKYYETRYEDYVLGRGNANAAKGGLFSGEEWSYERTVTYPFGYGLSYAAFEQELTDVKLTNISEDVQVSIKIKNCSNFGAYSPVQIYAKQPYESYHEDNDIEVPAIMLAGYDNVYVNGGETVEKTYVIPKNVFARYDEQQEDYIVDTNIKYYIGLADNAHDAINMMLSQRYGNSVELINADGTTYVGQNENNVKQLVFNSRIISNDGADVRNVFDDASYNTVCAKNGKTYVTGLSRRDWDDTWPTQITVSPATSDELNMANLMPSEYAEARFNNGYYVSKNGTKRVTLEDMKDVPFEGEIKEGMFAGLDGEDVWQDFVEQMTKQELCDGIADVRGIQGTESIDKPGFKIVSGVLGIAERFQYGDGRWATNIPCATILAGTFNPELQRKVGKMLADEALMCNTVVVQGPNLTIVRNPFGGDTCQYMSEDPIIVGGVASNMISAAKERGVILCAQGCGMCNQDKGRQMIQVYCDENVIRDLYMKPFEIAMKTGDLLGICLTYNRIGAVYAAANKNLMQDLFREQWGFKGFFMDSAFVGSNSDSYANGPAMLAAGTDIFALDYARGNQLYNANFVDTYLQEANKHILYALSQTALFSLDESYTIGVGFEKVEKNVAIVRKPSNINYFSSEFSGIDGTIRSDHEPVYVFEGVYSEGYRFDFSQFTGKIILWDDGIYSGEVGTEKVKGYWYNSSEDNTTNNPNCLRLISNVTYNGFNEAFDIGGGYSKGLTYRMNLGWGYRDIMLVAK